MQFNDYGSLWSHFRKDRDVRELGWREFYAQVTAAGLGQGDRITTNQAQAEGYWYRNRCPYYNVYPSIIPMLTRLSLDIDSSLVRPPLDELLIRFPARKNPFTWRQNGCSHQVRGLLMVARSGIIDSEGIALWLDIGERHRNGSPILTFRNFRTKPGRTVEQELRDLPEHVSASIGLVVPPEMMRDVVRLCCSLCLIGEDPEILSPDVLAKDAARFAETRSPIYIDRARRRGKVGWLVGRDLEVVPHLRRPHPALMWTGHGRTVPRIVLRKGAVVHRTAVERMPTGRLDGTETDGK